MEIRKQVLGEEHPDYAASLNNLALLHYSTADYARAEPLYHKALIQKKVFGEEHPSYANSLNKEYNYGKNFNCRRRAKYADGFA